MELVQKIDLEASANKAKNLIDNWKGQTLQIVEEVYNARECYSSAGFRSDLVPDGNRLDTFKDYLDYIGLAKSTAYRLLDRYIPEEKRLMDLLEYKEKQEAEKEEKDESEVHEEFDKEEKSGNPDDALINTIESFLKVLDSDDERVELLEKVITKCSELKKQYAFFN